VEDSGEGLADSAADGAAAAAAELDGDAKYNFFEEAGREPVDTQGV
jgi:hypothetical protein